MSAPSSPVRIALLLLWILLGALSYGFSRTAGLAYDDAGVPLTHVSELRSSGSNDDLCIEIGLVLAVAALLLGALRIRRPFGLVDVAGNAMLLAVQVVYLLAIEAGSIQQTIVRDRNWVLAAWLATFAALAGAVAFGAGRARWPAR
jgi:hypothetical protein